MAAKARPNVLQGLVKDKPQANASSVGEAPMDLETQASVTETAPEPAKEVEAPAAVVAEAPVAAVESATAEPAPRQVVISAQPQAALMPAQDSVQLVAISAPVHAKKGTPGYSQLSIKLDGQRLERFEKARRELRLSGQAIAVEALDIWLAHNGY